MSGGWPWNFWLPSTSPLKFEPEFFVIFCLLGIPSQYCMYDLCIYIYIYIDDIENQIPMKDFSFAMPPFLV